MQIVLASSEKLWLLGPALVSAVGRPVGSCGQPGSARISVAISLVDLVHEIDVLSVAFRVI